MLKNLMLIISLVIILFTGQTPQLYADSCQPGEYSEQEYCRCTEIQLSFCTSGNPRHWNINLWVWLNKPACMDETEYWSGIPWTNCSGDKNTVVTFWVELYTEDGVDGWPECWIESTDSIPFIALWLKVWVTEPTEPEWAPCTTTDCGGQFHVEMPIRERDFEGDYRYMKYASSAVMNSDQWFCYMPLCNPNYGQYTMYYTQSEWCGPYSPEVLEDTRDINGPYRPNY